MEQWYIMLALLPGELLLRVLYFQKVSTHAVAIVLLHNALRGNAKINACLGGDGVVGPGTLRLCLLCFVFMAF